jgi:CDP-paratose 2-epimerase
MTERTNGRAGPATPLVGVLEWFQAGDFESVERSIAALGAIGVQSLRTGVSWADMWTPAGREWYDWLLPRIARELEVLPCLVYTPPSEGLAPKTASPPRNPRAYADLIDAVINRHDRCFEYVELWNEPNNISEWDWTLDDNWFRFSEMVGAAAYWARQRGKKTVLGGMSPVDPNFLELMFTRGVMRYIDVVGIHGFPGAWETNWNGWSREVARVQEVLDRHESRARIWITETGYSTWRHDESEQLEAFLLALRAPVERVYWYGLSDLHPTRAAIDGFHVDERDYHFGMLDANGNPKLLYRLWETYGQNGLEEYHRAISMPHVGGEGPVTVVTGGAGFIGTNVADRELEEGREVVLFDNLSRPGVERNLRWLQQKHLAGVGVRVADVRNSQAVDEAIAKADRVFHFAAQVAVTTSCVDPVTDFEVNALGTLNVLEAIRKRSTPPALLFTSTNKVYGDLGDVPLVLEQDRYQPQDLLLRSRGIDESRPLDFHSPYGCSKGAADQYVLDFARTFGIPAVVLRMSCIYGPRQLGTEDQGWVAHFLIRALEGEPIFLYGDGRQVRDILFVEDLVDAMIRAVADIDGLAGQAFNIGGGPLNTVSLLELLDLIEDLTGAEIGRRFEQWRTGDQRYYVSDLTKFARATGWSPTHSVEQGVRKLYEWLRAEAHPLGAEKEGRAYAGSVTLR